MVYSSSRLCPVPRMLHCSLCSFLCTHHQHLIEAWISIECQTATYEELDGLYRGRPMMEVLVNDRNDSAVQKGFSGEGRPLSLRSEFLPFRDASLFEDMLKFDTGEKCPPRNSSPEAKDANLTLTDR
ncbi:hypothetical protein PROFUN_07153 [Planoprotostelium fungivorum]|uniref:Uncharacterized protein n=1 Tax=Planoprotostelium fungivorum TaxID=1890364 RepID=A0A2P6NML5_9EUKA|nr:hypothetical protein PROFUN_07153 [Planoprotostelium fungivorum]